MFLNKKVLGIIPARGGSKGIPHKNIVLLGGKPLIAWTIIAGNQSKFIDKLILSSDDPHIIEIALKLGCEVPFIRPSQLATDNSRSIDVVLHAMSKFANYDYIALLQPTSPLRTSDDIDEAFNLMLDEKSQSCVSVCEAEESPYLMYSIDKKNNLQSILNSKFINYRRQDLPKVYRLNGAIYIASRTQILNKNNFLIGSTSAFIMPKSRSIDIDDAEDLHLTESLINK